MNLHELQAQVRQIEIRTRRLAVRHRYVDQLCKVRFGMAEDAKYKHSSVVDTT